jgi:hypothetical protein
MTITGNKISVFMNKSYKVITSIYLTEMFQQPHILKICGVLVSIF